MFDEEPEDSKIPAAARETYLNAMESYNKNDAEAYYSAFADELECFYAKENVSVRKMRPNLSSHLDVKPEHLRFVRFMGQSRVVFCDLGGWEKNGKLLSHHKTIVMQEFDEDEWRIVVEVATSTKNACYEPAPNC